MLKMILDRKRARKGWESVEGLLTRSLVILLAATSHGRYFVSILNYRLQARAVQEPS
jgi:hypothetical protein